MAGTPAAYRCSFCGKRQEQVELLLAGTGGAYICEECVEGAWEQVQELRAQADNQTKGPPDVPLQQSHSR